MFAVETLEHQRRKERAEEEARETAATYHAESEATFPVEPQTASA